MNDKHFRVKRINNNTYLHVYVKYPETYSFISKNVIFVHGFLGEGTENHRLFIRIAESLNRIGYTCFLFDQYGCGYSDGDYKDIRLQDIKSDLKVITMWVKNNFGGNFGYLGQSIGSALLLSISQQWNPKFRICINPAAGFDDWLTLRYNWDLSTNKDYYYAIPKGIMVSRLFIKDLLNWNWINELQKCLVPTLVIAATNDEIGSVNTAYLVQEQVGKSVNVILIEGANHSFIGQRELEKVAINGIMNWLKSFN